MSTGYKRAILKISGEMLKDKFGGEAIAIGAVRVFCEAIRDLHGGGFELGIVVGGGNIFRGATANEMFKCDRVSADYVGMLATTINSMLVADGLAKLGVAATVFSSMPMPDICETYYPRHAQRDIAAGKVLLLAGGTGRAFFSTDSAAALRASELNADVVVKVTKVDGVYDRDPQKYSDAKKFDRIFFREVLAQRLAVMDSTAFSLCMDNNIPLVIVSGEENWKNIGRALRGEAVGTTIFSD
ncbi:MAG: UMP kinase [Puniceicoccales bacterium]|nr:UMP kinase [Puniceicoccales bacterium]